MTPVLSWNLPAEPVKNTLSPDFIVFRTWVCSGDRMTPGSSVTGGLSVWVDGGSLGVEGSKALRIDLPPGLGGRIGARRPV